jgi:autotransporter translocation and assembly factor TamB
MSARLKTFLRRFGIAVASIALLFTSVFAFLFGTESGTRWVLRQAVQFVPGHLAIDDHHGTFLRGLEIPRLEYQYGSMRIDARDLLLRVSWLRSSLDRVYLSQVSATAIVYRDLAPPDPREKPLQISMPALPIRIAAARVDIASFAIGDFTIAGIASENARLRGTRITADKLGASAAGIAVEVVALDTRLDGDIPLSASIAWRRDDRLWSGEATVHGSLAELDFSHRLLGAYPAAATGKAFLLNRIEPAADAVVSFERWVFGSIVASNGELHL